MYVDRDTTVSQSKQCPISGVGLHIVISSYSIYNIGIQNIQKTAWTAKAVPNPRNPTRVAP